MDIVQYKKKKRNDAFYFILATCSTENVFMGAPAMENMVNITGSVDLDIMRYNSYEAELRILCNSHVRALESATLVPCQRLQFCRVIFELHSDRTLWEYLTNGSPHYLHVVLRNMLLFYTKSVNE